MPKCKESKATGAVPCDEVEHVVVTKEEVEELLDKERDNLGVWDKEDAPEVLDDWVIVGLGKGECRNGRDMEINGRWGRFGDYYTSLSLWSG